MRKWIVIICSISMLFSATGVASASSAAEVTVAVHRPIAAVGKQVQVAIQLKHAPSAAGISFALKFDPTKVRIAKNTENKNLIAFGSDFASYGGSSVNATTGIVKIPLVVKEPLDAEQGIRTVVTVTFDVLAVGRADFTLEEVHVSSVGSMPIHVGTNGQTAIVGTSTDLYPAGSESAKLDVATVLHLAGKIVELQLDLNGDDVIDKRDIAAALASIEPVTLQVLY